MHAGIRDIGYGRDSGSAGSAGARISAGWNWAESQCTYPRLPLPDTKGSIELAVSNQQVAVMFAALVGVALTLVLPAPKMTPGMAHPAASGLRLIPLLFALRRSLSEPANSELASTNERLSGRVLRRSSPIGTSFLLE